jgi:hypothetical protein
MNQFLTIGYLLLRLWGAFGVLIAAWFLIAKICGARP